MTELLACPFCGGTVLRSGGDDKVVGFSCLRCEAIGPNHYGEFEWNTRTPEPNQARIEALEAEVERLRGALSGLANALELPHQRGVLTMVPGALVQARAALEANHD